VRSLVKDLPLNWVPQGWLSSEDARRLIAARLSRVAEWARYRHSQATGIDAELLAHVAAGLERHLLWARRKSEEARSKGDRQRKNAVVRAERLRLRAGR
jgi:hypothetical protein